MNGNVVLNEVVQHANLGGASHRDVFANFICNFHTSFGVKNNYTLDFAENFRVKFWFKGTVFLANANEKFRDKFSFS